MQDESTSMEVEGAKSASALASANDASAASTTMSSPTIVGRGVDMHRVNVSEGESHATTTTTTHVGAPTIASRGDAAANETQQTNGRPEARADQEEIPSEPPPSKAAARVGGAKGNDKKHTNNLRKLRIERMMSKAELARRANLSVLTIDRIEKGFGCRMDSKRKILEALGLSLADRVRVFGEEE
jgi:DNA-binding XRE family transcriptional regulator